MWGPVSVLLLAPWLCKCLHLVALFRQTRAPPLRMEHSGLRASPAGQLSQRAWVPILTLSSPVRGGDNPAGRSSTLHVKALLGCCALCRALAACQSKDTPVPQHQLPLGLGVRRHFCPRQALQRCKGPYLPVGTPSPLGKFDTNSEPQGRAGGNPTEQTVSKSEETCRKPQHWPR